MQTFTFFFSVFYRDDEAKCGESAPVSAEPDSRTSMR
jgi:hypothetical protein